MNLLGEKWDVGRCDVGRQKREEDAYLLVMGRNLKIYGGYLALLVGIGVAVHWGLNSTVGIVLAILIAAVYAVLWPRW